MLGSAAVFRGEDDGSLGAVPPDQALGAVDVDDASVFDDGYPVAQALGLLHKMGSQENGLAALADSADQVPDGAPRLGVEAGGQLVEKDQFRIVDQREGNEQSLLLAARQGHEPGISLVDEAKLFEQAFGVDRFLPVKGRPEVDGLPHFDALLQLCLLELNSNSLLQMVNVVEGIKTRAPRWRPGRAFADPRCIPSWWSFLRRWARLIQRSHRR